MIRVFPFGAYAHRLPLAYDTLRDLCSVSIAVTAEAVQADLLLVAHSRDLPAAAAALHGDQKLVLLSEEPLWDTVWSADPLTRKQSLDTPTGAVPFTMLNHATSTVYDFARIPYFLLTDTAFFTRYASWFARNAGLSLSDWRERLATPRWDVAFMAELRQEAQFDVDWPGQDLFGLGARRTRIALACNTGSVLRTGAGWNTLPRRQDLPDWHLEKYLDLDGQCRLLSAIENTHQDNYVSEKIFDAFAVGAVPLYIAGPAHRVRDVVPGAAFLNLYGLSPEAAGARIADFTASTEVLEAYVAAQTRLAGLFATPAALLQERERLRAALALELQQVLSG
ncbi:glycosyltransferase family 10 domain-containing protein [Puniceibacterium sediminis]|uniref:Glycosyltransferase family 10 (Fucosyltransferase) C-term n=1 Tax=Puniceibacterium sediminis TaxID=1608407 RepID=A0A238YQA7_9RHOB|nr:glycosyltransferase family 10 [Puniceibacterium sediminis]SNR72619.1 Glycosyltransferase family 10 (fucosyltransferase) C-term [Puniceibacterium sediminis]